MKLLLCLWGLFALTLGRSVAETPKTKITGLARANFISYLGLWGNITFLTVRSPGDAKDHMLIRIVFQGLDDLVEETGGAGLNYHIHQIGTNHVTTDSCDRTGGHLDPHHINKNATRYHCFPDNATVSCEMGDLSGKFGRLGATTGLSGMSAARPKTEGDKYIDAFSQIVRDNGTTIHDINGKPIVLHSSTGARILCADIRQLAHPERVDLNKYMALPDLQGNNLDIYKHINLVPQGGLEVRQFFSGFGLIMTIAFFFYFEMWRLWPEIRKAIHHFICIR